MIQPTFEILNQRGTPMFFSDVFSNRPTFGITGRIFISTDTAQIYRDTGSAWVLISDAGAGSSNLQQVTNNGSTTTNSITANSFIKSGGTSAQFLKADGTIDSNTYLTTGSAALTYLPLTGGTLTGALSGTSITGTSIIRSGGTSAQILAADGSVITAGTNITISGGQISATGGGGGGISGSGAANQLTYWDSASSITGSATLTYNPTSSLLINNSISAAANIARGINLTPTLTATANNDILVGLDISPTFTNGAFTSVTNAAIRIGGQLYIGLGKSSSTTNIILGNSSTGRSMTSSQSCIAIGNGSASSLSSGSFNSIFGAGAMSSLSTGASNNAFGSFALASNNGSFNLAFGSNAGRFISTGSTPNTTSTNSVYIGYDVRASANGNTNEIVISGYDGTAGTVGLGSNTTTIGNASTTFGRWYGNLLIGSNTQFSTADQLQVTGKSYFLDSRTYISGSIQTSTFDRQLTITNGTTISSLSAVVSAFAGGNTTFQGSATIPNSTTFSTILCSNLFTFSGAGTITINQAAGGVRAATSLQILNYFGGTASSTLTHYASNAIYGYFNNNTGTITPVITNAYQLLINDIGEFGHTFTFTNRWGIYQAGASDKNYLNGNLLLGSTTNPGQRLYVNGSVRIDGQTAVTAGGSAGLHLILNLDGTNYKIALLNV